MAAALAGYQALHGMEDDALAEFLGCATGDLPRLALCRRPDPESGGFRAGVEEIAAYAGVDATRLGGLLREVDAMSALAGSGAADRGLLMAARDRLDEEPSPEAQEAETPPGEEQRNGPPHRSSTGGAQEPEAPPSEEHREP